MFRYFKYKKEKTKLKKKFYEESGNCVFLENDRLIDYVSILSFSEKSKTEKVRSLINELSSDLLNEDTVESRIERDLVLLKLQKLGESIDLQNISDPLDYQDLKDYQDELSKLIKKRKKMI